MVCAWCLSPAAHPHVVADLPRAGALRSGSGQRTPQPGWPVQLPRARPLLPAVRSGGAALALLPPGVAQQGAELAEGRPPLRGRSGLPPLPLLRGGVASAGRTAHPHRDHPVPPAPGAGAAGMVVQPPAGLDGSGEPPAATAAASGRRCSSGAPPALSSSPWLVPLDPGGSPTKKTGAPGGHRPSEQAGGSPAGGRIRSRSCRRPTGSPAPWGPPGCSRRSDAGPRRRDRASSRTRRCCAGWGGRRRSSTHRRRRWDPS